MGDLSLDAVWSRYQRAKQRRRCWESLWRECYIYALPQRGAGFGSEFRPGANPVERLFDGTALDAVEQLGASLLAELTPPWSQWFGLIPGREVGRDRARCRRRGPGSRHPDRAGPFRPFELRGRDPSGFLDLVTVGSATLLFEEAPIGSLSAFRLSAVPMSEIVFEAGPDGQIDGHFRERSLPLDVLQARFPGAELPKSLIGELRARRPSRRSRSSRRCCRSDGGFAYFALLADDPSRPTAAGDRPFRAARRSSASAGSRAPARSTAARRS